MTIQNEVCDKCGKEIKRQRHGSLTQWIFDSHSCNCALLLDDADFQSITLCNICGKRLPSQKVGSLTQWVFRENTCSCGADHEGRAPRLAAVVDPDVTEETSVSRIIIDRKLTAQLNFPDQRYGVIELLGAGSFACVYKCWDHVLGKTVAIKVLMRQESAVSIIRFQNEARATSKLNHKNIVATLDFGVTTDSRPYMVMEYLEGKPLSSIVRENDKLSLDFIFAVVAQICDGMTSAHKKGIFHRDLKSSNIMIVDSAGAASASGSYESLLESPLVKIIDFGLATVSDDSETECNEIAGTPCYMAPEVARNENFDERSDIYSLGCILFETLTGSPLFAAETPMATVAMHQSYAIPSIADLRPDLEEKIQIDEFLSTALAKKRSSRFQSMETFKHSLLSIRGSSSTWQEVLETTAARSRSTKFSWLMIAVVLTIFGAVITIYSGYMQRPMETPVAEIKRKPTEGHALDSVDGTAIKGLFAMGGAHNVDTDDSSLKELARNPNTKGIDLSGAEFTERGLDSVLKLPLESIDLCSTKITDGSVKKICSIKSLMVVRLADCSKITGSSLDQVAGLPKLEVLWIGGTQLNDEDLKRLSPASALQVLSISGNEKMNGSGIKYLAALPNLKDFWCADMTFSSEGIRSFALLKHLRKVVASDSNIDDRAMTYFAELDELRVLDLTETNVTDDGLMQLSKMKNLKVLRVGRCKNLTRKGIMKVRRAMPHCRVGAALPYD